MQNQQPKLAVSKALLMQDLQIQTPRQDHLLEQQIEKKLAQPANQSWAESAELSSRPRRRIFRS